MIGMIFFFSARKRMARPATGACHTSRNGYVDFNVHSYDICAQMHAMAFILPMQTRRALCCSGDVPAVINSYLSMAIGD